MTLPISARKTAALLLNSPVSPQAAGRGKHKGVHWPTSRAASWEDKRVDCAARAAAGLTRRLTLQPGNDPGTDALEAQVRLGRGLLGLDQRPRRFHVLTRLEERKFGFYQKKVFFY